MRNVVERRSIIGFLRALGFRRGMILKAFVLELSFVAVLAFWPPFSPSLRASRMPPADAPRPVL